MGSLFAYEGDFGITLWSLLAFNGGFKGTLRSFWNHLRHMRVFLGALWRHVGASLGSLRVSVGDIGSCEDDFGIIVESLWVYEGPFSKTIDFPPQILMIL